MAPSRHTLRFKGVTLGQLTASEIAERLRAGEISLAHVVEQGGRWMTVRQFLREAEQPALVAPPVGLLGRLAGRTTTPGDQPPPPPGSPAAADPFESRVRAGYLWCGLTFLLPVLVGLPTWGLCSLAGLKAVTLATLWCLAAVGSAGYAAWRAHLCARTLREQGLREVGESMRNLGFALGGLSALFWCVVALKWTAT